MTENKVTFGLKNVHIAPIVSTDTSGTITYGDVFRFPGAIELTLDAKGDSGAIQADDVDYHFMNSNEGYEGKFKTPHIIEAFATKVLNEVKDKTTGVLTENADKAPQPFAMMFEFSGDAQKTRHVLYYCSASRPSTGSSTKSGTTVNERELSFKASPRPLDMVVKRSITSSDDETVYNNWFNAVYEPTKVGN